MKNLFRNRNNKVLFLILLLALGLRLFNITWGIDKNLPGNSYIPDEPYGYLTAIQIKPLSGELDPGNWSLMKGTFYYELIGEFNEILEITGINSLVFPGIKDSVNNKFYYTYVLLRFMTIMISLAIIIGIYYFCILLFKSGTIGLLAAFSYAIFAHEIPFSHILVGDNLVGFMYLMTLYFSIISYKEQDSKKLFFAALFSGLAIATKYSAVSSVLPVAISFLLVNFKQLKIKGKEMKIAIRKIPRIIGGFILGIIVGMPAILFKFSDVVTGLKNIKHYQDIGETGVDQLPRFIFYFTNVIYNGMGIVFTILILVSIIYYIAKKYKNKEIYIILPLIFGHYLTISITSFSNTRYILPLMPFFAIFIGFFIYNIYKNSKFKKLTISIFIILYTYNTLFLYNFLDAIHQPVVQDQFEKWGQEVALSRENAEIAYVIGYKDGFSYPVKKNYPAYTISIKDIEKIPDLEIPFKYVLISSFNSREARRIKNQPMIKFLNRLENSSEFKLVKTLRKNYKIPYIGNDDAYYSSDLELFFQKYYIFEKL